MTNDDICSMPGCKSKVAYRRLKVCRSCYGRIWWVSTNYAKSMDEAKAAIAELDSTAQRLGLTSAAGLYAHKKR